MENGWNVGGIWVEYQLYGWGMVDYGLNMGGVWVEYGCHMGYISGIWVEYGWNGVDGIISIVKKWKISDFLNLFFDIVKS